MFFRRIFSRTISNRGLFAALLATSSLNVYQRLVKDRPFLLPSRSLFCDPDYFVSDSLISYIRSKSNQVFVILDAENSSKPIHKSLIKLKEKYGDLIEHRLTERQAQLLFSKSTTQGLNLPFNELPSEASVILMNKYGDLLSYTSEEFNNVMEVQQNIGLYDGILAFPPKKELLKMNDHDYLIAYYVNEKEGDTLHYSDNDFTLFRKLSAFLTFSNITYAIAKEETASYIFESIPNARKGIYIIKRQNAYEIVKTATRVNPDGEDFIVTPITSKFGEDFSKEVLEAFNDKKKSISLFQNLCLKSGLKFFSYSSNGISKINALELFPMFYQDMPYYIFFTDMTLDKNRENLNKIFSELKKSAVENNSDSYYQFMVVDNSIHKGESTLVKTFEDKFFKTPVFKSKIIGQIDHFKPELSKKIIINDFSEESIAKIINTPNVTFEQNSLINRPTTGHHIQLIDHSILDMYLKNPNAKERKFLVYIKNVNESKERQSFEMFSKLAEEYTKSGNKQNIKFYQINNSKSNISFFKALFKKNCLKSGNINKLESTLAEFSRFNSPFIVLISEEEIEILKQESYLSIMPDAYSKLKQELKRVNC